ncbi:O-acetylhomoserine aminocarboxypropyltransferase/cysteine synthase [bacterium]|jgi:O-acetylhomoserine (thiol)-lyase|nr:O-acetylhomoserine aminocarboxypropyltransferase/cysteine synthase [bacterium]
MKDLKNLKFESKAIHAGLDDEKHGATNVPIYLSSAFAYETPEELSEVFQGKRYGHIYSRISNPTVSALEKRVNSLENGVASIAVATGMAAINTAVQAIVGAGDHIVASKSIFGGTTHLFEDVLNRINVDVSFVDPLNEDGMKAAIKENTQLIFVETIGNPKLDICNIESVSRLAEKAGLPLLVDATLTPPSIFNGKEQGASVVIHSSTKYMSGGGNVVGGVLTDTGNFKWKTSKSKNIQKIAKRFGNLAFIGAVRADVTNVGNIMSPFHASLFLSGLETLSLRVERHCQNAMSLASFLEVMGLTVNYPGLSNHPQRELVETQFNGMGGGMITLRLGSKESCFKFISKLNIAKNLANLGDMKTLVIHPASTIYLGFDEELKEEAGVFDDLIRVSVGCEHIDDIIADFKQALYEG